MIDKVRIAITYPQNYFGLSHDQFLDLFPVNKSIKSIVDFKFPFDIEVFNIFGVLIADNRNKCAINNIERLTNVTIKDFDYLFFIDSDIQYNNVDILNLYKCAKQNDYKVLSGSYRKRNSKDKICAGRFSEQRGICKEEDALSFSDTGIRCVDYVGCGFLIIHKSVFEALEYPFFAEEIIYYNDRNNCYVTGEDIYFCLKCKENNIPIYINNNIKVNHITKEIKMADKQITLEQVTQVILNNKLKVYEAKESFDNAIKQYNDSINFLLTSLNKKPEQEAQAQAEVVKALGGV